MFDKVGKILGRPILTWISSDDTWCKMLARQGTAAQPRGLTTVKARINVAQPVSERPQVSTTNEDQEGSGCNVYYTAYKKQCKYENQ